MPSILSVSQLNKYISLKLGGDLKLKSITVRGEISEFSVHYKSGHAYFKLKDDTSVLKGVMFARSASRLAFTPEAGMSVLCSGSIQVYEPNGEYQIIATELTPVGVGEKFLRLNAIKERLEKQGVFSLDKKKKLPTLPKKIAVVTSLNGAALQDVLNILKRRFPVGEVDVFPAQVQGEQAHLTIEHALKRADLSGSDVIILTRGGGANEDLMPFNTEEVVLAVSACKTPVITAVGHETDTTLVDYASDYRAPTPSAAAEVCAPTLDTLLGANELMRERLERAIRFCVTSKNDELKSLQTRLNSASPAESVKRLQQQLDAKDERLRLVYKAQLSRYNANLEKLDSKLLALSPYKVLERGYAIALKQGLAVTQRSQLETDDELEIRFYDFTLKTKVLDIKEDKER